MPTSESGIYLLCQKIESPKLLSLISFLYLFSLSLQLPAIINLISSLGIFAIATVLSAAIFGEGSFDKGFYFAIPLDIFYPNYTKGNISFGLHPLTKDGGAMLSYHNSLYGLLGDTNKASLTKKWNDLLD